ncbi:MAG: hypothetical protein PGN23_15450 [Sphingomonas adhaesiva]|uniref:hypothetical protein n=1 Tax=Sphingomonas adhaesiva TaxID=28212 RepID=UPI002FFCA151
MTYKGQYRVKGSGGAPDRALVSDGDLEWWIDKAEYQAGSAISPPWDDLPWRDA